MVEKELSASEKRAIRRCVKQECSLYDTEYGCLALSTSCYTFSIGYTTSPLCRYFEESILPIHGDLLKMLHRSSTKACPICGRYFPLKKHQLYCSEKCSAAARKRKARERVRRFRMK